MSAELDINAIRDYLLQVGCKIEYPILVNAFKKHLYNPDPNVQGRIRTQFKDYVNRLATVSLENNMKFINLKPEFRPQVVTSSIYEPNAQGLASSMPLKQQAVPVIAGNDRQLAAPQAQATVKVPATPSPPQQQQPITAPRSLSQQPHQNPNQNYKRQVPPPVPQHQREVDNRQQTQYVSQQQQHQTQQNAQTYLSHQTTVLAPVNNQQQQQQWNNKESSQQPEQYQQQQQQNQHIPRHQLIFQHPRASNNSSSSSSDVLDSSQMSINMAPPPPQPISRRQHLSLQKSDFMNLSSSAQNLTTSQQQQMPPPRPPPRRRQSTASLFKQTPKPIEKSREIHDLAKKSPGRVKEHALKLNSFTSSSDLHALMPIMRNNTNAKENRLSRDSSLHLGSLASALQRNGSHLTTRSRSSHREDESDSSSLQPIDPLRRKWAIEACNCNYNGLLTLLREEPKLSGYKDIVNGYTALHWAAKFGNLDIIKLIAGTHGVSANIKSSAGYTPLHVAYMFRRQQVADLLLKSYKANPDIRDHSGKRPVQYSNKVLGSGKN